MGVSEEQTLRHKELQGISVIVVVMLTPVSHVQREPRGEEAFLAPGHNAK